MRNTRKENRYCKTLLECQTIVKIIYLDWHRYSVQCVLDRKIYGENLVHKVKVIGDRKPIKL